MNLHFKSLKTGHRKRIVLTTLSIFALSSCQGALSNNDDDDDHHATKQSEGHHAGKSEDDHHGGEMESGHHGDKDEQGHHDGESSVGVPGAKGDVGKTIKLVMNDQMRFEPASIEVKAGETIQFDLENAGSLKHEMVIGETDELIKHGELMKKHPGMEHEEPNMLTLEAGTSGELIWKFTNTGMVNFACLQPGHYDAGMKGTVQVVEN